MSNGKRYTSLIVACFLETLAGITYAWSVFQGPIVEKFGWSVSSVSQTYTIGFIMGMLVSAFLGAKLRSVLSVKKEILIGSIIYGLSLASCGLFVSKIWHLYLFHGVIMGFGNTMVYPTLISYSVELFPDKPGFASGLTTAGFGLGAVFWAPVATAIYLAKGDISYSFIYMGFGFAILMVILSFLLTEIPEGGIKLDGVSDSAAKKKPSKTVKIVQTPYNCGKKEMLKKPEFYFLMAGLVFMLACGGMVVSQGSPIMQKNFGMSVSAAALIVSCLSICNMLGRMFWGSVSDKLGKVITLACLHFIMFFCMLLLATVKVQVIFIVILFIVAFCYGGVASLLAPITGEIFGAAHTAENYSITFCAAGLSSIVGPSVMAILLQSFNSYTPGFIYGMVLAVLGFFAAVIIKMRLAKQLKNK